MLTRILSLAVVLTAIFGSPASRAARAQTPKTNLSVEWIFSDAGRSVASLPSTLWLSDGKLMVFDARKPAAQRAFEILDPATGVRRSALDMATAVAGLNKLMPPAEARQVLTWPQAFDRSGRRALYVIDGDLFLLELATARFTRLTKTEAEERLPEFSPNGQRLAFVRANDLYLIDLEIGRASCRERV